MNENFLNLHVLVTTSVANPNRDDAGAPKQVTYGGATRHRMSSQAMTRSKRVAYELTAGGDQITWRAKGGMVTLATTMATDLALQSGQPLTAAERTALQVLLATGVNALVINREKALKAAQTRARLKTDRDAKAAATAAGKGEVAPETETLIKDDADLETGKKDTLVWLAEHELLKLVTTSLAQLRSGSKAVDFVNKKGRTASLSIAAFGRMFAFRPDLQNEAAVQRSHAFTTHAADIEPDYFTAVDDLPAVDSGSGAGHLDLNQFGGGVFYWHTNIDRRQLWDTWTPGTDDAVTRERLTVFFEALLLALPSGKQATTAHKTVPDAVLAVSAKTPIALHQAFETPIRASSAGYRDASLAALLDEHERVRAFTPRQVPSNARFAGTLEVKLSEHITAEPSLDSLVASCVEWALAGRTAHSNAEPTPET